MAYVQPPGRITRTLEPQAPLTEVHGRRVEGVSTRRLVLVLDVLVLVAFAAFWFDVATVVYAALALAGLKCAGVYGARLMPRVGDDVPRLFAAVAAPAIVLPWITSDDLAVAIVLRIPALLLALVVGRSLTYWVLHRARATGRRHERVLIVGAGDHARDLARILVERPRFGLEPIGFVDEVAIAPLSHPLLGGVDDLPRLVAVHGIDRVLVAEWEGEDETLMHVLRACTEHRIPRPCRSPALPTGHGTVGTEHRLDLDDAPRAARRDTATNARVATEAIRGRGGGRAAPRARHAGPARDGAGGPTVEPGTDPVPPGPGDRGGQALRAAEVPHDAGQRIVGHPLG